MKMNCPTCGKELKIWYSGAGGKKFLGCSDILCNYRKEIN
jgi:ssDNA-binding Zn-finger/Zn-ribbon topoisomerase 1